MSLAETVKARLTKLGIEQKDLAKTLGVAPSVVSDWVRGKTKPRMKKLDALASAIGVSPSKLLALYLEQS